MGFEPKYKDHKYKDKIIEHFEKGTPLSKISSWLSALGPEHAISTYTLRHHKKKYTDSKRSDDELAKAKNEFGDTTDLEYYLIETIVQCRIKKEQKNLRSYDYQKYDQQMQMAIKLLNEIRSSDQRGMSMEKVFTKLADKVKTNDAK